MFLDAHAMLCDAMRRSLRCRLGGSGPEFILLCLLVGRYDPAVRYFLVELMKSLSLLCDWRERLTATPGLPQHSGNASAFLVPSLLRKTESCSAEPEQLVPKAAIAHDEDSVGTVVKIAFKSAVDKQPLMPATMFPRVVCLCVEHSFAMPHQRMSPLVKHGRATLDLGGRDGVVTLTEGDNCLWLKLEAPDMAVVDIIHHKTEHVSEWLAQAFVFLVRALRSSARCNEDCVMQRRCVAKF